MAIINPQNENFLHKNSQCPLVVANLKKIMHNKIYLQVSKVSRDRLGLNLIWSCDIFHRIKTIFEEIIFIWHEVFLILEETIFIWHEVLLWNFECNVDGLWSFFLRIGGFFIICISWEEFIHNFMKRSLYNPIPDGFPWKKIMNLFIL